MRRMLTETEVEKLDSIKPSEIQKLGKITEADIESVQAMQSPKDAKANQVLTADGNGKAVYKTAAGGSKIHHDWRTFGETKKLSPDNTNYGKHIETYFNYANIIVARLYPYSVLKIGGTQVPFTAVNVLVGTKYGQGSTYIELCFSDEVVAKYNITADTDITFSLEVFYYD